jgi:SAM-dependent methyltransferase
MALDPYLVDVARRTPSHRFLGRATQACYRRQLAVLQALTRASGRAPGAVSVLDWGTGKGHISYLLRQAGYAVTSCDVDQAAEDSTFGQATPIVDEQRLSVVRLTHPWQLPFPDASFDVAVSFGVLEHVPQERESLRELRRILRPDGVLFFSFLPYWLSWTQRLAHWRGNRYHERLYRRRDVARLAAEAGFRVEAMWHGQLFPKNSMPYHPAVERLDQWLTWHTPLRYLATNLEGVLRVAPAAAS